MIDRISLTYAKNNTKLLGSIRPSVVYDKTRWDNDVTNLPRVVYVENKTEFSWPIRPDAVFHEN